MSSQIHEVVQGGIVTEPHFVQKHPELGSKIIEIGGRVFLLLYGSDQKLGRTGVRYMKNGSKSGKYNGIITREEESLIADIEELKKQGRGIIIGNHHSSKFPDYLPMFGYLGDDILEKTLFFTGPYNLEMNRREFPGYEFVAAVESGREEMHELMETVKLKLKKMKDQGGYIFLLPAGPGEDSGNKPFQALFGQILRGLCSGEDTTNGTGDIPVMAFHIEHSERLSYAKILLKRFGLTDYTTTLEGKLRSGADWPQRGGSEQRAFYNSLFKKSRI